MPSKALKGSHTAYRPDTARFLAECSEIAYFSERSGTSEFEKLGAVSVQYISVENQQAFVVDFDEGTVVVVRGTQKNYRDILTDLKFRLIKTKYGRCHRGFYAGANQLHNEVKAVLKGKSKIFYTGHSLGGDLAVFLAPRFVADQSVVPVIYTFGCARPGDAEFSEYSAAVLTHYRVVNACDIVPNLPMLVMSYRHTGQLIYISRSGEVQQSPPVIAQILDMVADFAAGLAQGFKFYVPVQPFKRHRITAYILVLTKAQRDTLGGSLG